MAGIAKTSQTGSLSELPETGWPGGEAGEKPASIHPLTNGSTTFTTAFSKSVRFLVTTVNPGTTAEAAIRLSFIGIARPENAKRLADRPSADPFLLPTAGNAGAAHMERPLVEDRRQRARLVKRISVEHQHRTELSSASSSGVRRERSLRLGRGSKVRALYARFVTLDFSSEILAKVLGNLAVLAISGAYRSDLGKPGQVMDRPWYGWGYARDGPPDSRRPN